MGMVERKVRKALNIVGTRLGLTKQVGLQEFIPTPGYVDALKAQHGQEGIFREFFENSGRPVHKWTHYLPIYERYFASYRNTPLRFLEIGVFDGGSLDFWRRYFGEQATIVGIDINPKCAERVSAPNHVRIGSQADPEFLERVAKEFGPFDIILDDGSHVGWHQQASFDALYSHVKEGGLYIIEDTHTSYWPDHDGGFRRSSSAIELGKSIVDDMHGWYHFNQQRSWPKEQVPVVHFYDSVIVFEKDRHGPSRMIRGGGTMS